MTVTEYATLEVLSPHNTKSASVEAFFQKVAVMQSTASGYPMLFFEDTTAPATVYILAGWEDAGTHQKWIESEGNKALLAEMLSQVAVKGMVHLEVDFKKFPSEATIVHLAKYANASQFQTLPNNSRKLEGTSTAWKAEGGSVESGGSDMYYLLAGGGEQGAEEIGLRGNVTEVICMKRLPY